MKPSDVAECLAVAINNRHPIMLSGKPGVGKTDLVKQASKLAKANLIVSHPVVSDPTDYKGLPWITCEKETTIAKFLPFSDLYRLVEAKDTTLFLLDDLGQAPPTVQAAAMQLILGRRINEVVISDYVVFFACTNRREDMAGVQGILEPVKSRFVSIIEVQPDVEDWAKWAISERLPFGVINCMRWKPELLCSFTPTRDMTNSPSPRSVAHACKIIMAGYPKESEMEMISGAVGQAWMIEWQGFKKLESQIPNVEKILESPQLGDIPREAHMMYALCGALAERANDRTFSNIIVYANRIAKEGLDNRGKKTSGRPEFSIMLVKDCLIKDAKLRRTKDYIDWQLKHKDVII